jgi:raffinose/stachyose/melibiose transport system substrate-binding protein
MFSSDTRRRRGLAVLAVVGSLALAGCSTTSGGSDGEVQLTLAMQNPDVESADPATWAIVEAFEDANPDVDVEITGQAVAEHLQNLTIAAQSDTLPDIFWVYRSTAEEMLDADKLFDLGPILEDEGVLDRLPESTVEGFSRDEFVFGAPYQQLLTGLWVNEKILEEHGLQTPTTWTELVDAAETLRAADVTTISNGANQSAFSVWSFLAELERFGFSERIEGILDGSDTYANEDFLQFYEHLADLRDAGAFAPNVSTKTYQQAVDSFLNGDAAMLDAGVWAAGAIQESPVADQLGFWAGPEFDDGVGPQNLVMNVASAPFAVDHRVGDDEDKLDAVTRFLSFYYSDESQQILVDNGQPPVTDYEPDLDPEAQSALQTALDTADDSELENAPAQPDLLVPTPVANAMYDSIYGVIQDQLTPQEAVDYVQSAIDDA